MFQMGGSVVLVLWMLSCGLKTAVAQTKYYGLWAGEFKTQAHGVEGSVYVADERTLFIRNFHYDGQGPDAFFWGDTTHAPTPQGFIIPIINESENVLKKYRGQNLILRLPEGKSVKYIKSLAVWCRKFAVNFGSLSLPSDDVPSPKSLGPLPSLAHGVRSDDVIIQDSRTLLVTNLYYDGAGPDAFFLVGNGLQPHAQGTKVPDENGRLEKLRGYAGKDVLLRLPGDLTVFDIDWFALYCIRYQHNFGSVVFPEKPNVPARIEDLEEAASTRMAKSHEVSATSRSLTRISADQYYGVPVGEFRSQAHDVAGAVFAASEDTFYIVDFHYDGQGPDAYFWAGTTPLPSPDGFIVPDERGTKEVLGRYSGQSIAITLPSGKKISDIKWLSVWCRKFAVNFGYVVISEDIRLPKAANLGRLSSLAHGVRSDDVIVKDIRTIFIRRLYYDGAGPDAFFFVGSGAQPHLNGTKVPDENGSLEKLHGYSGQDIELRLPEALTVFDISWLALYCISFRQNFGHVMLTGRISNVPADLKALRATANQEVVFDNCEELFPGVLHVSWKIQDQQLLLQMAGKVEDEEYISFGRSGRDDGAAMIGADVAVAFFDPQQEKARVVDYFLSAKSQCSRGSGACPDKEFGGRNDVEIISWQKMDKILRVNFKRPLSSGDDQDQSIPVSVPVSVVAAVGPLNSRMHVAYHTRYYNKESKMIHFGRVPPQDRCSPLGSSLAKAKPEAWEPLTLSGPTTFKAQIGPAGGDKGYTAITGSQSWGIAWWINGFLIPEITVRRGVKYTFLVEGGDDPSNTAKYHPLYITNNPEGGGVHFIDQIGSPNHTVYAGISINQNQRVIPTGAGRYCEWKHSGVDQWETSATFEEYRKTLKLDCDSQGHPAVITWTPDENTPDTVYYQCFFHLNLGWKIRVLDSDSSTMTMGHLQDNGSSGAGKGRHNPGTLPFYFLLLYFLSLLTS